jgi:hypothetical protein
MGLLFGGGGVGGTIRRGAVGCKGLLLFCGMIDERVCSVRRVPIDKAKLKFSEEPLPVRICPQHTQQNKQSNHKF